MKQKRLGERRRQICRRQPILSLSALIFILPTYEANATSRAQRNVPSVPAPCRAPLAARRCRAMAACAAQAAALAPALTAKAQGTACFAQGDFAGALRGYNAALEALYGTRDAHGELSCAGEGYLASCKCSGVLPQTRAQRRGVHGSHGRPRGGCGGGERGAELQALGASGSGSHRIVRARVADNAA